MKKTLIIISILIFLSTMGGVYGYFSSEGNYTKVGNLAGQSFMFTKVGNNIFYYSADAEMNLSIWVTNGTTSTLLKSFSEAMGSQNIYVLGNKIYFNASTPESGNELWVSDGTESGTRLLKEFSEGSASTEIRLMPNSLNGYKYFSAKYGTNNPQLWKTNGTNTVLVKENIGYIGETEGIVSNNCMYFNTDTTEYGHELWKTDGTSEGTVLVKDIIPGNEGSYPFSFTIYKDKLYFVASVYDDTGSQVNKRFVSDGTEAGTVIFDVAYGENPMIGEYCEVVEFNGIIYFAGYDAGHGTELWRSNGTSSGTYMLKDLNSGEGSSYPACFVELENKLYFTAIDPYYASNGYSTELWETDGTAEGTKKIRSQLGYMFGWTQIYTDGEDLYFQQANNKTNLYGSTVWGSDLELWKYNTKVRVYTVTFKNYDGTVLKTQSVTSGGGATAPTNTFRTGYSFTGWDKTFNNITSGLTLTAQYKINKFSVQFKDYDGTILKSQTVEYGRNAIAPSNPTRTGYVFKGWNTKFSNITNNVVTTAIYSAIGSNDTNNSNSPNGGINNTTGEKESNPEVVINDLTNSISKDNLDSIKNNIRSLNEKDELINLYDISLMLDGVKIQPEGYIDIKIKMTNEQKEYENLKIVYIDDNNKVIVIPHTIAGEYIIFSVNHLSNYAVVGTKAVETNETDTMNSINYNRYNNDKYKDIFTLRGNHLIEIISILIVIVVIIFIIVKRRKKLR